MSSLYSVHYFEPRVNFTPAPAPRLHMFLSDTGLSYSAYGANEAEARAAVLAVYPSLSLVRYLGAQ